ncbi:MAG: translational GTPase TypA [Planctomycetaceae bacterium]|nr:translational GTPase TypA [Planctomycetaceae bacterium]
MNRDAVRNIVIIAHVDHGKTTLVDCLLRQSGQFRDSQLEGERILDSNDLERERGITILAKNISIPYRDTKINIIDTPGHADFGGEVERVLQMADGALLLVDAAEGPMPQTRFVLSKALEHGLRPIVVINKIDRPDSRALEVVDETLALIIELGGDAHWESFCHVFASAKAGFAKYNLDDPDGTNMQPILDLVLKHVPPPKIDPRPEFRMRVTTLDWSEFVGRIMIGRIESGAIHKNDTLSVIVADGSVHQEKVAQVFVFDKLGRTEVLKAEAGDIVALVGLQNADIGDTITDPSFLVPLPRIAVDLPTLQMMFTINSSPLAGRDGKYVTGRQLRTRLFKELERNVALRVEETEQGDRYAVSGRGVLHLSVLIETMRREGFELSVGKPQVLTKYENGVRLEPSEHLVVHVPTEYFGSVMEAIGNRRGDLIEMTSRGDQTVAHFDIPSRGLIGLRARLLNATKGTIVMNHRFKEFREVDGKLPGRQNGALIANMGGKAVAYSLFNLQARGEMFVSHGDEVYEGMVVGEHCRSNDLPVNVTKEKQLTNVRAAGSDENIILKPARKMSLEEALEYIEDDEWVEITPKSIRIRKAILSESERRRRGRVANA